MNVRNLNSQCKNCWLPQEVHIMTIAYLWCVFTWIAEQLLGDDHAAIALIVASKPAGETGGGWSGL